MHDVIHNEKSQENTPTAFRIRQIGQKWNLTEITLIFLSLHVRMK